MTGPNPFFCPQGQEVYGGDQVWGWALLWEHVVVLNPCDRRFWGLSLQGDVMGDRIPRCPVCTGVVKPDIVFFGEQLPQRFLLHLTDFPMADLLFVIGTSLEVWQ